jgi:spermidine synthase
VSVAARPFLHRDAQGVTMFFELSSIQSRMRLDDPDALALDYTRAMVGALLLRAPPQEVLLIGLGGGSLVKYLHHHEPAAVLTVVEINPQVIALREVFQVPPDSARLHVRCEDGAVHVVATDQRYDWILVDGFDYDGQPEALCTADFYARCRARLASGGVLIVNLQADDDLEHRLLARLRGCFDGQALSLRTDDGGNRVVFAGAPCTPGSGLAALRRRWAGLSEAHRATLARVRPALLKALAGAD